MTFTGPLSPSMSRWRSTLGQRWPAQKVQLQPAQPPLQPYNSSYPVYYPHILDCDVLISINLTAMRLLSVNSLAPCTFDDGSKIPPYAILSHTWGEEEVSLNDLKDGHKADAQVYDKIHQTSRLAAADGLGYFWIDSCCIDKTSSAELSEAINSMFMWYERSERCYAFLEDVTLLPSAKEHEELKQEELQSQLKRSRWFTRGWTLQELLAPKEVHFYDRNWNAIGTRTTLGMYISDITSIDRDVLCLPRSAYTTSRTTIKSLLADKSIAQRMSWASHRNTTRPEDLAYCLLGLFDINMPLIYGEGLQKAFFRLQAEVLRDSTDQTLLAWSPETVSSSWVGALAVHPRDFASGRNLVTIPANQVAFEMSNRGLKISMQVITKDDSTYAGIIACHEEDDFSTVLAIPLLKDVSSQGSGWSKEVGVYLRNWNLPVERVPRKQEETGSWKTVCLLTRPPNYPLDAVPRHFILEKIRTEARVSIEASPKERWNEATGTMQFRDTAIQDRCGALAVRLIDGKNMVSFGMAFGVTSADASCPYIRLYHGPPSGAKAHTWLEKLAKNSENSSSQLEHLFFLDHVLKAEVQKRSIFGKAVFVLSVSISSVSGGRRKVQYN